MNPERAVEIIENLVDGIHPLTKQILPEDNICEDPAIIDALHCAIHILNERIVANRAIEAYRRQQRMTSGSTIKGGERKQPENAGNPWSTEDDARLLKLYKSGYSVEKLSALYKRTDSAIRARLTRLGMADNRSRVPKVYRGFDPIDNDELRYRLLHGETIPQLAKRYGKTESAIRARLFYMGLGGSGPNVLPKRKDD